MSWFGFGDDEEEEKKEDVAPIENEDRAAEEARFQEQCFLMRAITSPVLGRVIRNRTKSYANFIKISAKDPALVMSQLTTTKGADELLDITERELAHLQPMIRIFKVSEDNDATIETEYRFNEGSFSKLRYGQEGAVSFFADRDTRGADVGLQSVNFEWLATQPAEVSNNIRCSIKLFFQNLRGLTTIRTDPNGKEYRYADLILRPPGYKGVTQYKPEHYRIKLIVGWAKPPIDADIRPEVVEALIRTRTVLNLTLKNHTFDFRMDGTVVMDIEYHAWAEGALSHPATDLFYPSAEDAKRLKQLDAAEDFSKKNRDLLRNRGEGAPGEPGTATQIEDPPDPTEGEEQIDENLEDIRKKRNEIKRASRAKAYRRFLSMLLESDDAAIYYIDVNAKQLGKTGDDPDSFLAGQNKRVHSAKNNKASCKDLMEDTSIPGADGAPGQVQFGRTQHGSTVDFDPFGVTAENNGVPSVSDIPFNDQPWYFKPLDWFQSDPELTAGQSPKKNGTLRVNYFYFGDLLNMCLKLLIGGMGGEGNEAFPGSLEYKNSPASKVSIMCGPMLVTNPCSGIAVPINLADIPISLNLFTAWFTNTIIRKQVDTYLLRTFINDVMGTLLPGALGEGCIQEGGQSVVNVSANVITVRNDEANKPPFEKGQVVDVKAIMEKMQSVDWSGPIGSKRTYDYLFLYATGFSPNWLGGDKEMDRTNGIYHFHVGADRGLIKSLTFDKNDAPYLGEAKVTGKNNIANDLGGGGIYHCSAELVGNSLFVPGQYIFVDPSAMGIGHPAADGTAGTEHSIANRIRLGGYYFIHKVESTLERGNFTTSISAKFEAGGGKSEKPPATPSESLAAMLLNTDVLAGFNEAGVGEDEWHDPSVGVGD